MVDNEPHRPLAGAQENQSLELPFPARAGLAAQGADQLRGQLAAMMAT